MNGHCDRLILELRRRGVATAAELVASLKASQPTVSRLLSGLEPEHVLRVGRGRSTRYALKRPLRGRGTTWALYSIEPDGSVVSPGQLHALERGCWHLASTDSWPSLCGTEFRNGVYPGLPWFLQDLRPRGFLGRVFAHRFGPQLGSPIDPRLWNDDDIALALLSYGYDLPGSLVLGDDMLAQAQSALISPPEAIDADACASTYTSLAEETLAGQWPGSSAAGEQPKFTARVGERDGALRRVLVKFSGDTVNPEARRWADLLIAEDFANRVLSKGDVPCANTRVLQHDGRAFLESTRFDRVGTSGRRGLVSLEALDAAFFGEIDSPWTAAAARLLNGGWITPSDADRLALTWWFGTLIGNTDMHYGNASLFLAPCRPLALAPVYDMAPMAYRPGIEGRLPDGPVTPPPPPPTALPLWRRAATLAERFWADLSVHELVSPTFRHLAAANAAVVAQYRQRFGRQ